VCSRIFVAILGLAKPEASVGKAVLCTWDSSVLLLRVACHGVYLARPSQRVCIIAKRCVSSFRSSIDRSIGVHDRKDVVSA